MTIIVGDENPYLDVWLRSKKAQTWAMISWHNPNAIPSDDADNIVRHEHLLQQLRITHEVYEGEGRGVDGWKSESSCLVLNISRKQAEWFASFGQQVAYLYGVRGESAELIYTNLPTQ